MFDYLQKFNDLPKDLRNQISAPEVMRAVLELENEYQVDLAALVMKVMVKNVSLVSLSDYLIQEFSLPKESADKLKEEMIKRIFYRTADYLGLASPVILKIDEDLEILLKRIGLVFSSEELASRLKNILSTYRRGIRNKIDTKNSLAKKVEFGGLNLSVAEIDRIFKILDGNYKQEETPEANGKKEEEQKIEKDFVGKTGSLDKLNKIILESEAAASVLTPKQIMGAALEETYNLKSSIAAKKQKELMPPLETESLPLEEKEQFLPKAKKELSLPLAEKNSEEENKEVKQEVKQKEIIPEKSEVKTEEKTEIKLVAKEEKEKPAVLKVESEPKLKLEHEPEAEIKPLPVNLNFNRPAPIGSAFKPQMQDIKPVPKIMSPVEELQFLDLVNFRRLGEKAEDITEKIYGKIKLLEKDGYDKMVQGVRAWRKSEVNRLYVKIGQEAVLSGTSIRDAILTRQKSNLPCLKIEEIEAISKLNSSLSF